MTLRIVLRRFGHIFGTLHRSFEQKIGTSRLAVPKEAEILSFGSFLGEGGLQRNINRNTIVSSEMTEQ